MYIIFPYTIHLYVTVCNLNFFCTMYFSRTMYSSTCIIAHPFNCQSIVYVQFIYELIVVYLFMRPVKYP